MGFVARPAAGPSRQVVELGLEALRRLGHRGGMDADGETGDGAGLLIQIPRRLFGDETAVASVFEWDETGLELFERSCLQVGMAVRCWRPVPNRPQALGSRARATMPRLWQALIDRPGVSDDDWESLLLRARKRAEREAEAAGIRLYVASASCRTVVYKAMTTGPKLADFYPDLTDPRCESSLAVFHQRYATNTMPDWRLAQPFRTLAHNGEINSVSGNRDWMRAREAELEPDLRPVTWPGGSDSASLDEALEMLLRRGYGPAEALMALVPDAWEGRGDLAPAVRDFYRYQSTRFEPWDGPAALAFSDGAIVGVALDRNGLRPIRYLVAHDGLVVAASEAGVVTVSPADVVERGRLGPGQILLADVRDGRILRDREAKEWVAGRQEYGALAGRLTSLVERGHKPVELDDLGRLQRLHGWGAEDVKIVLRAMVESGAEPVYSMGDDTPLAPLGATPRRLYGRLRQRFAQVTNPPIDPIRERAVMSLRTLLGPRGATLAPPASPPGSEPLGAPLANAGEERRRPLLELASPVLGAAELARVLRSATVLEACLGPAESLAAALVRLRGEAAAARPGIVVLSDRGPGERVPIPMALAVGAVHEALVELGQRTQKDLVAVAGDVVEVHDLAMLITAGASAVHPYLALATAMEAAGDPVQGEDSCRHAFESGLTKVMAKMGISTVASYCGARILEAVGLGADAMAMCFPTAPSRLGGACLADLEAEMRARHAAAAEEGALADHGRVRFRKTGEWHAHNPIAVRALQRAAASGASEDWETYRKLATAPGPASIRDLLTIRPGVEVPLDEVEPAATIISRFVATAMSLGSLSPEAHGALAVAMNRAGARSHSGEGGEDPALYRLPERRDSKVKQVASGRFGVTRQYLRRAEEIEIKIAQGSKPGEGGQLPGAKVTALIARLRHAQPGMQLISPPPHHDIYSIEDLAQLIHDLKAANPAARVGVKLVAESGVGTIAAGVAKAGADYILISGHEGGTGASPLSSIKNAGVPWEIGLAETQRVLAESRFRDQVRLRVDGGLRTGRDVAVAAMLGAEEFGFGTTLLIALGCDMARQCHLNTCPTGIATQREDLRAKFAGRPEDVIGYLTLVAEDVRRILASVGARSLAEVVGRVELLEAMPEVVERGLDLAYVLEAPSPDSPRRWSGARPRPLPAPSPDGGEIGTGHRSVGADATGVHRYRGSAGQSFGAWCAAGLELELEGEANDYVGKGMSGGSISIWPFEKDAAWDPVLAGNTCLYGATGGRVHIAGRAGERFAVRNSGAVAVVEGAGDHFCEYMTGGVVVSLGPVGFNAGAGMTGGTAFAMEWKQLHRESVEARHLDEADAELVRGLISEHLVRTGSARAAELLARWDEVAGRFRKIVPAGLPPAALRDAAREGEAEPGVGVR